MSTFPSLFGSSDKDGEPARVLALKQRIGYPEALAAERHDEYVALKLENFAPPAAVAGWAQRRSVDRVGSADTELDMRFTQGEAIVTVTVLLFPPEERQRVAQHLIDQANAVTRADITDVRGPRELGTLSLTPSGGDTVRWIFRNVFAEIVVHRSSLDKFVMAADLQSRFEMALRHR